MTTPRWVQHKSGIGEKWQVTAEYPTTFDCTARPLPATSIILPKSEYVLCPPTEQWSDVTAECEFMNDLQHIWHRRGNHSVLVLGHGATNLYDGYRLVKVRTHLDPILTPDGVISGKGWAFIVEKREP